ncbi:hypothetical protein AAZX31_01G178200 [Glycine max]
MHKLYSCNLHPKSVNPLYKSVAPYNQKVFKSLPNCMCSNTARGLLHQDEKNIIGFFFLLYKNHCHEVILISSKSSAPSKRVSLKAIAFLNFHMNQQVACQIKCFHLRPFLPQINKPN